MTNADIDPKQKIRGKKNNTGANGSQIINKVSAWCEGDAFSSVL
jgi:hypothetical protein